MSSRCDLCVYFVYARAKTNAAEGVACFRCRAYKKSLAYARDEYIAVPPYFLSSLVTFIVIRTIKDRLSIHLTRVYVPDYFPITSYKITDGVPPGDSGGKFHKNDHNKGSFQPVTSYLFCRSELLLCTFNVFLL